MNNVVSNEGTADILKVILAFILPPLAVFMEVGASKHFWISVILTLFFWIPGVIHAIIVVLQK